MAESHHDHGGNYGPVVGALFFIAIVTAGSLAVARYCVGAQAFYRTGYDLDAYVQRKFAVCLGTGRGKPPCAHPVKKKACHDLQPEAAEEVEASEPPAEEEEEESAGAASDP
ncbi:hypothetical protein SETIT_3G239800v2 [Setaria italica]|uniref:Uncharacterized protein n=4 Tax=Setaria TaxID=4554 RepID=A0A368QIH7_SETIT|nr:hypothetical protein SETIT_3G239800v2 [Setaria italica]TKW27248.1 hypothetical protein SEVIR_3G245400v2 [Setaria viridis]